MSEPSFLSFFSTARQRIVEATGRKDGPQLPPEIKELARNLITLLEDVETYLSHNSRENAEACLATYSEFVHGSPRGNVETPQQLVFEINDVVSFLECADLLLQCTLDVLVSRSEDHNKLLISQNTDLDKLLECRSSVQARIEEQRKALANLDVEITLYETKMHELEAILSQRLQELEKVPCTRNVDVTCSTARNILSQRLDQCNVLLESLNASPLSIVEESQGRLIYRYKNDKGESYDICISEARLQQQQQQQQQHQPQPQKHVAGSLVCTIEPTAENAHEYITKHLSNCKTRLDIAAVIQEAFCC